MARAHAVDARLVPDVLLLLARDIPREGHTVVKPHIVAQTAIALHVAVAHNRDVPVGEVAAQPLPRLQQQVGTLVLVQMRRKDDALLLNRIVYGRRRSASIVYHRRLSLHPWVERLEEVLPFLRQEHHTVRPVQTPDEQPVLRMILQLIAHVYVHHYLLSAQQCQQQHRQLDNQTNLVGHGMEVHNVIPPYREQRLSVCLQRIPQLHAIAALYLRAKPSASVLLPERHCLHQAQHTRYASTTLLRRANH